MEKTGLILPRIPEKQISIRGNSEASKSRREIVKERLEKRRNELRKVCPPINHSRNIMDIERKALGPLIGPLVEWQMHRANTEFPDGPLRLQEAKVEDWLVKNRFRINRLPRLDPIVLTNRGADFSKYTNFVFPAPYCLRFKSKARHRRISYEEVIQDIRELCPRLLRTQRDNRDLFNLNPVIRVGGGYRRLSWRTAEILPSIGQTENDVTSEFTCVTCGINLAVTQEVSDGNNEKKFVVTYPNICANCGKPVIRKQKESHARDGHALPPLKNNEGGGPYEDRDYEMNWHREATTGNPNDHHSEYDTGFSLTPEDSVFITEPDGSTIRLISKSSRDQHHHNDSTSRDNGLSSRELNIIEHSDPKSGIRVRVKKRSSKKAKRNSGSIPNGEETGNDSRDEHAGELGTNGSSFEKYIQGYNIDIDSSSSALELDSGSGYGRSARNLSSRRRKPKSRYSIYYKERNAKSDSELHIPSDRYLFLTRIRRKRTSRKKRRGSQKSGRQSHAGEETEHSSEEWERVDTADPVGSHRTTANSSSLVELRKRKETLRNQSGTQQKRSAQQRKQSNEQLMYHMEQRQEEKRSAKQRKQSDGQLNNQREQRGDHEEDARAYPDGYTADSEEESLMKLQAQLQQFKKSARKKSSGKTKTSEKSEKSKTRKQRAKSAKKTTKVASAKKAKASLAAYGLDSDSWDSDVSLHLQAINDEYFFSDDEHEDISKYGRPRALSFDISDLPSYRRNAGFYELSPSPRAMTMVKRGFYSRRKLSDMLLMPHGNDEGEEHEGSHVLAIEWNEETDLSGHPTANKTTRHRYTSRKYPRKVYKPVPLATTQGRSQYRSKWDEDNLNENDIKLLTAQMQKSFTPKETKTNAPDIYCKGQSCFRCGTFIDECEGTCTVCGTHCKGPNAPCTVCRDTCERCGKPKVRCESRGEIAPLHDEGIGMNMDDVEIPDEEDVYLDEKGYYCYENEENDDYQFGSEITSTEGSLAFEVSSNGQISRRRRRPIKKKEKNSEHRVKRGTRARTSTFDSTETLLEESTIASTEDYKSEEEIEEESRDFPSDVTVAKPEKSKYTKSTKKFKSSKQVVSQTVVHKNKQSADVPRDDSLEKIDENSEDNREKNENESDKVETQSTTLEETAHETQRPEREKSAKAEVESEKKNKQRTVEKKEEKEVEKKEKVTEVTEEKTKPKIPKPKLRGVQRVNAAYKDRVELNKRLQSMLKEALSNVIAEADIRVRRDSTIDYLAQYRLVDRSKVEVYGRAFTLEDESEKGILTYEQMLLALEGVPTIQGMSRQQLSYVLQVLEINTFSRISFKMFAVITALCEKVTSLDPFVRELVEGMDLTETEWKLDLYKDMFYVAGDRSVTFISPGDLRIELKAGGLNQQQEDHVIKHIMQSAENGQISFLDYMAYLPLFMSIHQNICTNALDMSRDKYTPRRAKTLV